MTLPKVHDREPSQVRQTVAPISLGEIADAREVPRPGPAKQRQRLASGENTRTQGRAQIGRFDRTLCWAVTALKNRRAPST